MEKVDVKTVKKRVDEIPETALEEVYDYLEFLKWRATKKEVEFEAWARNLAKERGFSEFRLTRFREIWKSGDSYRKENVGDTISAAVNP